MSGARLLRGADTTRVTHRCCRSWHAWAGTQAINKVPNAQPFSLSDEDALCTFCEEVGMALKRRSVEAALVKMLQDNDQDETELNTEMLSMYALTTARAPRPCTRWPRRGCLAHGHSTLCTPQVRGSIHCGARPHEPPGSACVGGCPCAHTAPRQERQRGDASQLGLQPVCGGAIARPCLARRWQQWSRGSPPSPVPRCA